MIVEYVPIDMLKTYELNAKRHNENQINELKDSIIKFGMNDPIAVWKDNTIIEGHGRYIACIELGMKEVPVIRLTELSDEQRRAYALVHNLLTLNTGFNEFLLREEVNSITSISLDNFGLSFADEKEKEDFYEPVEKTLKVRKVICQHCGKSFYLDEDGNVVQ